MYLLVLSIVFGVLLIAGLVWVAFFWEKGRRSLELAVRSLWLHKLRAALSVLGIVIGTGAVIALMGLGEGSMQDALEDIKRLGATNIIVRSVKPPEDGSTGSRSRILTYGLTYGDYDRFLTISEIQRRLPLRVFPLKVRRLEYVLNNGRVVGTTPEYADVNQLELASGRFLTDEDNENMTNVAVLGAGTA